MSAFMLCNVLSATDDACGYRSTVHPHDRRWQLRATATSAEQEGS